MLCCGYDLTLAGTELNISLNWDCSVGLPVLTVLNYEALTEIDVLFPLFMVSSRLTLKLVLLNCESIDKSVTTLAFLSFVGIETVLNS